MTASPPAGESLKPESRPRSDTPVEIIEASKWYGEVIGVNQITLSIGRGVTGLLGPNGAGKSTLLKLITGQLRPGRGSVRVFGLDPWRQRSAFRRLGYCPDVENLYEDLTALDFVTLLGRLSGYGAGESRRRAGERLELAGLGPHMTRRIRGYSKGMRQRVKLAAALLHDPDLIVLDEPLNGLDPAGRLHMLDLFRRLGEEGKAVLVSSHILHEIENLTPRVALMHRGRLLAEGTVEEIRSLIDKQPLTLRIETPTPRPVAQLLAGLDSVVSLEFSSPEAFGNVTPALTVRTNHPDSVCEVLQAAAVEGRFEVLALRALDENLDAVFGYLTR